MLSREMTLSVLSIALLMPFADSASNSPLQSVSPEVTTVQLVTAPAQNPLAQRQQTGWESFVYKVHPLGKYIAPISGYVGAGAAALALGLSLRNKAPLRQAFINATAMGGMATFATANCLFWPYFGITESLD